MKIIDSEEDVKSKTPTHYDKLNVSKDATNTEIEAAYNEFLKKYNPSKFENSKKEQALKVTSIAKESYETLINSVKRKEYDKQLEQERYIRHRNHPIYMKIEKCKICGFDINTAANFVSCPQCKNKLPKKFSFFTKFLIVIICSFIMIDVIDNIWRYFESPEAKIAGEKQNSAELAARDEADKIAAAKAPKLRNVNNTSDVDECLYHIQSASMSDTVIVKDKPNQVSGYLFDDVTNAFSCEMEVTGTSGIIYKGWFIANKDKLSDEQFSDNYTSLIALRRRMMAGHSR